MANQRGRSIQNNSVEEEEPASDHLAKSESILRSILRFLLDIFDTRGCAVVVVIQLVEGPEVLCKSCMPT